MKKKTIILGICFVVIFICLAIAILSIIFKPIQPKTLLECKIKAWEKCGLVYYENSSNNCYRTLNNTNPKWFTCQLVTLKEINCWKKKLANCEEEFINDSTLLLPNSSS